MPIRSDIHIARVPLDGRDFAAEIKSLSRLQASRDPDPRRLVATFACQTQPSLTEVILVFELANQNQPAHP